MTEDELYDLHGTDENAYSVDGFIQALNILRKYMDEPNKKFFMGAEHDELYIYSDGPEQDTEDGHKLLALGWHYDKEISGWGTYT